MGRHRKQKPKENFEQYGTDSLECRISPLLGRHLVTKRDIKKGELLLKENWVVAGPTFITETPICIGCHSQNLPLTAQLRLRCGNCRWYICSDACSGRSPFHTSKECTFLSENKIEPPDVPIDFGVITVLRCLMLKLSAPENWNQLISLQSHNEQRNCLPRWKKDKILVELIRKTWNLGAIFSADEIFNVCGILEVNGFEMGDGWSFHGIFLKSSMIAHDCVPNCSQNENIDEGCIEVNATANIPSGTTITICYDGSLEGTKWRQQKIQESKYFICSCTRCHDPTELGTDFSSLVCIECKKGFLRQMDCRKEEWTCSKCLFTMSNETVSSICTDYKKLRTTMDSNIGTREEFLKKCELVFHQNHFIPFRTQYDLCMSYGHDDGFSLTELTQVQVARKLELCAAVMKVLEIICPGSSVARGNILYELQAAQVLNVKQCLNNEKCSRRLVKNKVKTALSNLEEAISIFDIHYSLKMLGRNARQVTLVELTDCLHSL